MITACSSHSSCQSQNVTPNSLVFLVPVLFLLLNAFVQTILVLLGARLEGRRCDASLVISSGVYIFFSTWDGKGKEASCCLRLAKPQGPRMSVVYLGLVVNSSTPELCLIGKQTARHGSAARLLTDGSTVCTDWVQSQDRRNTKRAKQSSPFQTFRALPNVVSPFLFWDNRRPPIRTCRTLEPETGLG